MALLDGFDLNLIGKNIDDGGEEITLRTVTNSSYSDWGDASESTSDETGVKIIFNIVSQEDVYNKETIFRAGDLVFFFKGNQANITRGNRIYYNSKWFEIYETIPHSLTGTVYVRIARVKPI